MDDPARKCLVVVGFFHGPAEFHGILHGKATVDAPLVRFDKHNEVAIVVGLVGNLADDLLDDVLHGDEAVGAAVFVHDDGHLHAGLLQLRQQLQHVFRLGHVKRLVHELGHRVFNAAVQQRADEVFVGHEAYDLVHFLVIDRQAGIARAAHAVEGRAGRFGVLGHDHVDARLHDFAHRHVGQIEDVVDHALLVFEKLDILGHHVLDLVLRNVFAFGAQKIEESRLRICSVVYFTHGRYFTIFSGITGCRRASASRARPWRRRGRRR